MQRKKLQDQLQNINKSKDQGATSGQAQLMENQAMTAELNMRRKQLQQLNLMRKKNQQREYKAILIENLQRKDMRQTMMVQRKQAQQENCLRMNQAI